MQFDLRQSEFGARQLAVIAGRLLGRPGVGRARLLGAAGGLGGAALPVAGPRHRGRVDAADADAGKMLGGGRRIVQEAQRDPARGEFLLGLVDIAGGKRRVARDQIGVAVFADVEHFARQQPPFDPPFVQIVQPAGILRRAQHQLRGLGELFLAAQQLDLAEDVAGIAMQFARNRVQQGPGVGGLLVGRDARLRQRDLTGAEPLGGAQCGLVLAAVEQEIHPRLVIARRDQRAEQIERRALGILRHRIASPGAAHQALGIGAVAARDHGARQRELALGRQRRFVFEPSPRPRRRRDGRPTAPPRGAGAGKSARASLDWPR